MSLHGKFLSGLALLLIAGIPLRLPLQAQWKFPPANAPANTASGPVCRDIVLEVTDANGMAIMGADIGTETHGLEITTNSEGFAAIPCRTVGRGILPTITVAAPGYKTMQVNLIPDVGSPLAVRLDRGENSTSRAAGPTVNASELNANVQKQSEQLQRQAEKAMAEKDFDSAEKYLVEALQLTPSSASISNNLGILALRRNDLSEAVSWFQKASEAAPYKPDILGNLGLVKWMQRQYQESYTILTKAYSQGYESGLGNYILGTIELRRGQSKNALAHLKKTSAERFPNRNLYLSLALRSCGKQKEADESYRDFLKHNPVPYFVSLLR
jgi:Flp pilus assembly protein TadD